MNNTIKVFVIIFAVIGCISSVIIAKDGVRLRKLKAKYKAKKYSEIFTNKEEPSDEVSQHNER